MSEAMGEGVLETLIIGYIKLRDKKKEIQDEQKLVIAKYDAAMEQVEDVLRAHLKGQRINSIACDAGHAFINRKRSATVADTELFRKYVISSANFDIADFRAKVEAVETYISDNDGRLPPGVNYSTFDAVSVHRK